MDEAREYIKNTIIKRAHVKSTEEPIVSKKLGTTTEGKWIMDFRRVIFEPKMLESIAQAFWEEFKDKGPIQVCGLETASIPLLSAIALLQPKQNHETKVFFMRKSRKKDGLMRMIEGTPDSKKVPVVLVDDILNSGKTSMRQIAVLEELGFHVSSIWTILRYRPQLFYDYFQKKHIQLHTLFELDDLTTELNVQNLEQNHEKPTPYPYSVLWKFTSPNPNFFYVVPKSDPVIDDTKIYMGSDSGVFWALNQNDGSVAWSRKVGLHVRGKSIFSSPALHEDTVFFGAYDGNLYALNTETGKPRWIFWEADTIGSSPAIATNIGLVFIGMEFGLMHRRGGIAAVDIKTGKKVWDHRMVAYTHSSPLYIPNTKEVVVGGNEGVVYLFDAKKGALRWTFKTGGTTEAERAKGFSRFDIKESFAYDLDTDLIIFGNFDSKLFAVNRATGTMRWVFDNAEFAYYSTPLVYNGRVYASSLDKHLYCIDIKTGKEIWRWNAGARIFASPCILQKSLFIGANTGRLTELDPETGEVRSLFVTSERITNKPVYNHNTERFFVPTFANEIYCITKEKKESEDPKEAK